MGQIEASVIYILIQEAVVVGIQSDPIGDSIYILREIMVMLLDMDPKVSWQSSREEKTVIQKARNWFHAYV